MCGQQFLAIIKGDFLKCEKCGKDCKNTIMKDKEHGWVCMDCYQKIMSDRLKKGEYELVHK